ncbi:phthiocerol/phthiodiolone dimycocerosyl transferase family protein [Mycobacteroides salmoniphilum]|uniref:phthiocerol/phthiodiolone dimycocerosyl transferase family protein n=1 Tax=Mycobacteroides salmoniphilum TaxID=404941 RepID=UPI00178746D1|nr:hypothetical protein [Mycobacteroides salmoniphilum]
MPASPEELLSARGIAKTGMRGNRDSELRNATPSVPGHADPGMEIRFGRVQLSESATAMLRASAKAHGQTMHALVAGAAAVATRRFLPVSGEHALELIVHSPVDIRARVSPAIPVWGGTNALGVADALVSVHPKSNAIVVGADVVRQIQAGLDTGAVHRSFLDMPEFFGGPGPAKPLIVTTNLGAVDPFPVPEGITIIELRGSVTANWPQFIAAMNALGHQAHHPALDGTTHIILTYAGRLSIDVITTMAAPQVAAYTEALEEILLELGEIRSTQDVG